MCFSLLIFIIPFEQSVSLTTTSPAHAQPSKWYGTQRVVAMIGLGMAFSFPSFFIWIKTWIEDGLWQHGRWLAGIPHIFTKSFNLPLSSLALFAMISRMAQELPTLGEYVQPSLYHSRDSVYAYMAAILWCAYYFPVAHYLNDIFIGLNLLLFIELFVRRPRP